MTDMPPPRLVFTLGDPAGIGPEQFVRSLPRIATLCRPEVVAHPDLLDTAFSRFCAGALPPMTIIPVETPYCVTPGTVSAENGRYVVEAVREAVGRCLDGRADAMITGPISKKAMSLAGFPYPGHTEMLREMAGVERTMMLFMASGFSVVLHTVHVPLMQVGTEMRRELLSDRIRFAWESYRELTGLEADLRVCGLNPHAGEQGRLGTEDEHIRQAVNDLASDGLPVDGPFPADTLFGRLPRDGSVLVYAMYHDQGLTPIKTLDPHGCVNITLGLPFIRASVSHGTAFDIAWQGLADCRNLEQTVSTTIQLLGRKA